MMMPDQTLNLKLCGGVVERRPSVLALSVLFAVLISHTGAQTAPYSDPFACCARTMQSLRSPVVFPPHGGVHRRPAQGARRKVQGSGCRVQGVGCRGLGAGAQGH